MSNERMTSEPVERIPADPDVERLDDPTLRAERLDEPTPRGRSGMEEDFPDPETGERPAGTGKIALFAVCVALILGAVFYGMNHSESSDQASTPPPAQTAQTHPSSPPPPAGTPEATPHANTGPGVTTGSATSRPTPPQSAPQGSEAAPK